MPNPSYAMDCRPPPLIARDPAMLRVVSEADRLAEFHTTTVLIEGETGTGKELVAQHIHHRSLRKDGPYIVVDCATIPSTLMEAHLFGHEKGSFTGADSTRKGLLELADKGTLLFDEISNLDERTQCTLLRFLETHEVNRIGNGRPERVDVRVIAASNQELERLVRSGEFRSDLYHRLTVGRIWIPPIRERRQDIEPLFDHFLSTWSEHHRRNVPSLTGEAEDILLSYQWPGNVRQIRNAAESMLVRARADQIESDLVLSFLLGLRFEQILKRATQYGGYLRDPKFLCNLIWTWRRTDGCVGTTADTLGVSKASVSRFVHFLELKELLYFT
jgi:transcriptional regulator with PAS, ATPase and Fis domain